jgi:hypothetical protein
MMRHAKRTDHNHSEIRDGLRAAGYVVADLSAIGHGVPDLRVLVSTEPMRCLYLEIKVGNEGLTDKERDWFKHNPENSRMVNSLESALTEIEKFKDEYVTQ